MRRFGVGCWLVLLSVLASYGCKTGTEGTAVVKEIPEGDGKVSDLGTFQPRVASECGNGKQEAGEQCDTGANNGAGYCSKACKWANCVVDPNHAYLEDEWPIAACFDLTSGKPVATECVWITEYRKIHCFDCRGQRTRCERLKPGYQYATAWKPPATDGVASGGSGFALNNGPSGPSPGELCQQYASKMIAEGGKGPDEVDKSPFRFGTEMLRFSGQKNASNVAEWCVPTQMVNCAWWNANPGDWRAPEACRCYAKGRGRTWANCNEVTLDACPWASGSGCGLFLTSLLNTNCEVGPDPRNHPEVNFCYVDIPGTQHDFCCAKSYYTEENQVTYKGAKLETFECNGCNGGQHKTSCSDSLTFNLSSPRHAEFPCYGEWNAAVRHINYDSSSAYRWKKAVDTELRLTNDEVVANRANPDFLDVYKEGYSGNTLKADGGKRILVQDWNETPVLAETVKRFCKSGDANLTSESGFFGTYGVWTCK